MPKLDEPLPEPGHWDRWENRTASSYVWGEPEKIGQLGQEYSKAGAELERLTTEFGKLSGGDPAAPFWKGDAANAFAAARDQIVPKLEQAKKMHSALGTILKAYGLGNAGTVGGADGGLDQWKTDAATAFTEGQAAYQDWKKEQGIIDRYNQWLKDPKSVQKPPPEQEKNSASVRQHNIEPRLKAAAAKLGEARETRNSSGSFTGGYIKDTISTAAFPNDLNYYPPGYPR
jgi:hypothetical protein